MFRAVNTRWIRPTLAAMIIGLAWVPGGAKAENLADALVGAYNTSGLLKQNRALLRAADEDVALAVASLRPVVDFITRITRTVVNDQSGTTFNSPQSTDGFVGFTAEWLLYDGGTRIANKQALQETVLATRQGLLEVEQLILQRAVAAYMNVLRAAENVGLRENNVRVLGEELRASQDRFEVGEVTRTDVALSESSLAAAQSSLVFSRGDLVNAQEEYLAAVGTRPGSLDNAPRLPAAPASLDEAKAVAMRNHPSVLQAQHQVAASELVIRQAQANLGPTASLRGDVGWTNDLGNDDYRDSASITLELRQRLYQGGARSANIRQAMASRDSFRANLLTVQEDVAQDVATAYVGLQVATASLAANRLQIEAAQVAFDGIREEATLGARTTLDVLTAEQDLLDAQALRIDARASQYIAAYQLLAAQGLLTAERLGLGVQIYDPAAYYNQVKNAPSIISRQGRDLDRVLQSIGKQ